MSQRWMTYSCHQDRVARSAAKWRRSIRERELLRITVDANELSEVLDALDSLRTADTSASK